MGRDAKRKKQARRDQRERRKRELGRPRLPEGERFSSVGQTTKDGAISRRTQAARPTVGFLTRTHCDLRHPDALSPCTGMEIHHRDGTTACSLGNECPGEDAPHTSRQCCGLSEPCDGCGIPAPLLA